MLFTRFRARRRARADYFAADKRIAGYYTGLAGDHDPDGRFQLLTRCATAAAQQRRLHTAAGFDRRDPEQAQVHAWESVLYRLLADVEYAVAYPGHGRRYTTTSLERVAGDVLGRMAAEPDLATRVAMYGALYAAVLPVVGGQAAEALACLPSPFTRR